MALAGGSSPGDGTRHLVVEDTIHKLATLESKASDVGENGAYEKSGRGGESGIPGVSEKDDRPRQNPAYRLHSAC